MLGTRCPAIRDRRAQLGILPACAGGMLVAPDANGYAITATTADLLKIANSAGGTSVTYTIAILATV